MISDTTSVTLSPHENNNASSKRENCDSPQPNAQSDTIQRMIDPQTVSAICEAIAQGDSLRKACQAHNVSESTFRLWEKEDSSISTQYAQARETRANRWAEEFIEISDTIQTSDNAQLDRNEIERAKLRLDARKWIVSRILPKQYGDRVQNVVSGPNDGPVEFVTKSILED
jgi:hypothetical protein